MTSCHEHLPPVDCSRPSAVSILSGEHRVIVQMLDVLDAIAARAVRERHVPVEQARPAIEVIRLFADRCHHGKEEEILFPALEAQIPGFAPTQVMRSEHIYGRERVADMAAAVARDDHAAFAAATAAFTGMLRAHIVKEDDILFRMAQAMLTPAQDAAILDAYRAVEHDDMGDGTHERLLGIADALADAYGIARASSDPQTFMLLTAVCGCTRTGA